MLEKKKRPEPTRGEVTEREKPPEHRDDPILRKMRYPDKGVHRVKYVDDELVVTEEE